MDTIHQELHEFLHSPRRLLAAMSLLLFGSAIIAQIAYPHDRTMPFAVVDGQPVGAIQRDELIARLRTRYEAPVDFRVGTTTLASALPAEAGMVPDYSKTLAQATDYSWWERMIPFSLLTRQWSMGETPMHFRYETARLQTFVKERLLPRCNNDATSATIAVKNDQLILRSGTKGRACSQQALESALRQTARYTSQGLITLPYEVVYPVRSQHEVDALFKQTKQAFADGIALEVDGTIHKASAKQVISWLVFKEDKTSHQLHLGINSARIRNYLVSLQKKFYRAPTVQTVYLLDGMQQRQQQGKEGRTIALDATQAALKKALLQRKVIATATMEVVVPETRYVNDYSLTSRGLAALLQNLAREKGNYGISVIELDGKKRVADANGTRSFTTASTYKIFVAYGVLKEIEAGRMTWGQIIRADMNTEDCWAEMLVYSMNPCSWVFADLSGGWGRLEQMAHANGMVNTYLNASDKRSTSNDEALYFAKLETAQLLQGASRSKLIETLRHQHYRSGIPTGTGLDVADKIGFLDGYLHDVGIVYAPKGRYVLGVMTYGGSWSQIADVARRVNEYMQR